MFLRRLRPGTVVILSYVVAVCLGSVLFSFDFASTGGRLSFADALFTSTSAFCVTGLTVVDTGKDLSSIGQVLLLLMIQTGGLGFMTFSVFLFLTLGLGVSSRERVMLQESFANAPIGDLYTLLKSIFLFSFLIEAGGAVVLLLHWLHQFSPGRAAYLAVFHSISAFCNAGFSPFPESLMSFRGDLVVNLTFMVLIILGGLGFFVLYELSLLRSLKLRRMQFSLHSRMVLCATAVLILFGAVSFYLLESHHRLGGLPLGEKVLASFFQSVTARTAGFNTTDTSLLSSATLFILLFLMFTGASPGSCGGGIKTTSVAALVALMYNRVKGRGVVNLFRRTIPGEVVTRAAAIVLLAILTISFFAALLMMSQPKATTEHFLQYLFEAFSAFGTVGLSMGATANLNVLGKLILVVLMLLGRVGLLTVAYAVVGREARVTIQYNQENVMIG
jgi:trk system potassium uptake protein TrkH